MPHHFYSLFCRRKFKDDPDSAVIYTCFNRITNVARYFGTNRGDYFKCKVMHLRSNAHLKNERVKCNVGRSDVGRTFLNWAYFDRNSWRRDPFDSTRVHQTLTYSRVCRIPNESNEEFRFQMVKTRLNQEDNRTRGIEMDLTSVDSENEQKAADYIAYYRSLFRSAVEPINCFDSDSSVDYTTDDEACSN